MKNKNPGKVLDHPLLNIYISFLIVVSLAILLVNKIGHFPPASDRMFDLLDLIFLVIFSLEFIIKIVFLRSRYFFKDLGWIDLLAALPVFTPLIKYVMLSSNMDAFLASDVLSLTIVFRGLKFIRFVRILRTTRLLKFITIFKRSERIDKPELSLTVPIIFSLLVLVGGYFSLTLIENSLKKERYNSMLQTASVVTEDSAEQLLVSQPQILIIHTGDTIVRKMPDQEIKQTFRTSECSSVKVEGTFLFYSTADILDHMNRIETILIVFVLLYLISVFFQFHFQFLRMQKS